MPVNAYKSVSRPGTPDFSPACFFGSSTIYKTYLINIFYRNNSVDLKTISIIRSNRIIDRLAVSFYSSYVTLYFRDNQWDSSNVSESCFFSRKPHPLTGLPPCSPCPLCEPCFCERLGNANFVSSIPCQVFLCVLRALRANPVFKLWNERKSGYRAVEKRRGAYAAMLAQKPNTCQLESWRSQKDPPCSLCELDFLFLIQAFFLCVLSVPPVFSVRTLFF